MQYLKVCRYFFGLLFVLNCQPVIAATSPVSDEIATHLYSGNTDRAAEVAQGQIDKAPGDDTARFALGLVQFFQAVEHLGQQLYRYGLRNEFEDQLGLSGLPILRLPVPTNPTPEDLTFDRFQGVLAAFVDDLDRAEKTLDAIAGEDIDLQLNLGQVRLDFDGDGQADDSELVWIAFQSIARLRGLPEANAISLIADLDASDVPWLQAYCHLLMGIAEFPLAYDWRDAFDLTFFNLFGGIRTPLSTQMAAEQEAVLEEISKAEAALDAFIAEGAAKNLTETRLRRRSTETWREFLERRREFGLTPTGEFTNRVQDMRSKIRSLERIGWMGQIADLIAFIHLNNWPLTEPERMQSVLFHLETVVRLSRENWRRILAETDNRNEWIPNPAQTGIIPGVQIRQEQVDGWHLLLDEFDALLKGEKLVPHWRFAKGVNLRRIFTEPADFDGVLFLQGTAALPYLEEGEVVNNRTWRNIENLLGGDILRYFIWFN